MYAPLWLKNVLDCLQMKMDQFIDRCLNILCIHDDLFLYGKSEKEHDIILPNLMQVTSNIVLFNSRKCQRKCLQITFCGAIFSKGMKPDPEKIQGITEMAPLRCTTVIFSYVSY